jgi:HSP20 family protein
MLTDQNVINKNYESNYTGNDIEKLIAPYTDIVVSKDGYQLFMDMPGIAKENFNLKIDNDELIITGKKPNSENNHKHLYNEIFYSGYHRHFVLPNDVDSDKIDASYKDGVLKLFLHKKEETKPRVIEIK